MKSMNVWKVGLAAVLTLAWATTLRADSIDITLTETSQTATAGTTITFDATITNLSSTDTIFLNGDSSTTSSPFLTVDDAPFLTNFPLSLDPNQASGPFALFNVLIDPNTPAGTYDLNLFSILGGLDGNASDTIGAADFSVTVVGPVLTPEPGSLALVFAGLLGTAVLTRLTRFTKAKGKL